jgi:hypothetical protein
MTLNSDALSADLGFALNQNVFQISKLKGKYYNSRFDLIGDVTGFLNPLLNLYGNLTLDIRDSKKIYPKLAEFFDKYDPKGILSANVFVNGPAKQPKNLELGIKASSDKIIIKEFSADNLRLDLRMKDRIIQLPSSSAGFYGGTLSCQGALNLENDKSEYAFELDTLDIDLSRLIKDTELENKNITGMFNSKLVLQGQLDRPESVTGDGWIRIRDGYLWEAPFLIELSEVLYLANVDKVAFKEAFGTFTIKDKQVSTQDLTFYSELIRLVMKGYVDFDQRLSFDLIINFSEGLAQRNELTRLGYLLVTNDGEYIGEIKIKGTIKEHRFVKKLFPVEKILKEKVLDLFENILK